MKMAEIRKYGKATLFRDINLSRGIHWEKTHRMMIVAKKNSQARYLLLGVNQLKRDRSSRDPFQKSSAYDLGNQSEW